MNLKKITTKKTIVVATMLATLLAMYASMMWWPTRSSDTPASPDAPAETIDTEPASTTPAKPVVLPTLYDYVEITEGCGPYFSGTCLNMRAGPGTEYPVVLRLRTGMVLRVSGAAKDSQGALWYKIDPGPNLRYPERIKTDWYIIASAVLEFKDDGDHLLTKGAQATTSKRIIIDRSAEMLYAYDGDSLFMEQAISVGLEGTPTPLGTFQIYAMTPSRYMQGPILEVSDQYYDLPGVPWNLYFTKGGAVIHGAYWHDQFGHPWSHGCVNMPPELAKQLYQWAELGTPVTVQE